MVSNASIICSQKFNQLLDEALYNRSEMFNDTVVKMPCFYFYSNIRILLNSQALPYLRFCLQNQENLYFNQLYKL